MTKHAQNDIEQLVAHDVRETIWLRLGRLRSANLCRKVLHRRHPDLAQEVLDRKSAGVASAIRSCLGYWQTQGQSLNTRVLSRYYAVLQASIAEVVASADPGDDLVAAQKHTEQGHGLFSVVDPDKPFPDSHLIGALNGGHFYIYCKRLGVDLSAHVFARRPRTLADVPQEQRSRLISLTDFMRRIPELQPIVAEALNAPPLSFQVAHASQNLDAMSRRAERQLFGASGILGDLPAEAERVVTVAAIYAVPGEYTPDTLSALGLPFDNIEVAPVEKYEPPHFIGQVQHSSEQSWWECFEHYKSGHTGTSVIAPYWGTNSDPFLIHLATLYTFSIVVRYLPSLWHDIEQGNLDHIHSLLEYYLSIVDNVLPQIVLERITDVRIHVAQPGGFDAPV